MKEYNSLYYFLYSLAPPPKHTCKFDERMRDIRFVVTQLTFFKKNNNNTAYNFINFVSQLFLDIEINSHVSQIGRTDDLLSSMKTLSLIFQEWFVDRQCHN